MPLTVGGKNNYLREFADPGLTSRAMENGCISACDYIADTNVKSCELIVSDSQDMCSFRFQGVTPLPAETIIFFFLCLPSIHNLDYRCISLCPTREWRFRCR